MSDFTHSGLLFNAANIPCAYFIKLCSEHEPDEIFTSSQSLMRELGMTEAQILRVMVLLAKDSWCERELSRLDELDGRFITAKDIDYPAKLFDLKRPPVGLYVRGKANLSLPSVAIVGTRKPSQYGHNMASALARELAHAGLLTVSGGAKGIDTAAHRGSLECNGVTVAVFGTSIEKAYPVENRDLFGRILERGAVVSEYPMGTPGEGWHFPERNRVIAALASKVVIAEAPGKSGANITARYAGELGRELWSIPGRINDETNRGTNELIYKGAKCLYDIGEFMGTLNVKPEQLELFSGLYEYEDDVNERVNEEKEAKIYISPQNETPELSDNEKIIYALLQKKGKVMLDELISVSRLSMGEVQEALIMLEALGLVQSVMGRYSVVN